MIIKKEVGIKDSSQVSSLGSWMTNGTFCKAGNPGEEPGSACVRVAKMNSVGRPAFSMSAGHGVSRAGGLGIEVWSSGERVGQERET